MEYLTVYGLFQTGGGSRLDGMWYVVMVMCHIAAYVIDFLNNFSSPAALLCHRGGGMVEGRGGEVMWHSTITCLSRQGKEISASAYIPPASFSREPWFYSAGCRGRCWNYGYDMSSSLTRKIPLGYIPNGIVPHLRNVEGTTSSIQ